MKPTYFLGGVAVGFLVPVIAGVVLDWRLLRVVVTPRHARAAE